MPTSPLAEDEFRLLAYVRAYSDRREQHLDPQWVQKQLEFSMPQLQRAARELVTRGLATFFEWEPSDQDLAKNPELAPGIRCCDISLTEQGWDYLRYDR